MEDPKEGIPATVLARIAAGLGVSIEKLLG